MRRIRRWHVSPGIPINFGSPAPEPMNTASKPSSSISSSMVTDFPMITFVSILTPRDFTFSTSGCTTPSLRKTELRNTVDQYAAWLMQCLENGYVIAQFCQIACTGQTCRTGTDDCYFLAVLLLRELPATIPCSLAQSATKRSSLPMETASPLIPRTHCPSHWALLWANTSTDCRKCRRQCDDFRCLLNISRLLLPG